MYKDKKMTQENQNALEELKRVYKNLKYPHINYNKVPVDYMAGAVERYIERGIEPGDFLTAVITNDLRGTFNSADKQNRELIEEWITFFHWEVPERCHGNKKIMHKWIEEHNSYCQTSP